MNKSMTKVMTKNDTQLYVNNIQIENVESYIYLGHRYITKDKIKDKEIQRRITAGWTAFAMHRYIVKGNILPEMIYGAEPWALTTQAKNKLAAAQTKMEINVLNITFLDRKTNIWVRENIKVTYVIEQVRRQKWTWAGHVSRIRDNRWTLHITNWQRIAQNRQM